MLRRKVKSYRASRRRQRHGVFGSSTAGERLHDVSLCTTTILS
jgi:hypothetical protein